MPCSDDSPNDALWECEGKLDRATQAACELARVLRDSLPEGSTSWKSLVTKKTRIWVKKHDEMDQRRINAELAMKKLDKLRRVALKKLTEEEREALGLPRT